MSDTFSTKGLCIITNYDQSNISTRDKTPTDVTIIGNTDHFTLNKMNFGIFGVAKTIEAIAKYDGNPYDLSFKDLELARKDFEKNSANILKWEGIKDIKHDKSTGETTITDNNGCITVIDFINPLKGDFKDFSEALAGSESKGRYNIENTKGFIGKYQMGEAALEHIGLYKKNPNSVRLNSWDGTWTTDTVRSNGKQGKEDFKRNKELQEFANLEYKKTQWEDIKKRGLDKYIGKKVRGCKITASGLLAGAHLKGVKGLKRFLEGDPKFKTTDGYGTDIRKYITLFSNYDVSQITDKL